MQVHKSDAIMALKRLATTEDGQILLAYLTAQYGFTTRSMIGLPNPIEFYEGQRSILVDLALKLQTPEAAIAELKQQESENHE
jgi:hypothetical protein